MEHCPKCYSMLYPIDEQPMKKLGVCSYCLTFNRGEVMPTEQEKEYPVTSGDIDYWRKRLSTMNQQQLGSLQRFAISGHPVFNTDYDLHELFKKCFNGWNPELSKKIGWEKP